MYELVENWVAMSKKHTILGFWGTKQGGSAHNALVKAQESDSIRSQDGLEMEEATGIDSADEFETKAWWR